MGTFDGVHLGHRKILEMMKQLCSQHKIPSVLVTFWPHPRIVLKRDNNKLRLLNTIYERKILLAETGINHLLIQKFSREFAALNFNEFVQQVLVEQLGMRYLIIGYDHHFGHRREGNLENVQLLGKKMGFEVKKINALSINETNISSTKIRKLLQNGQIEQANKYLSSPYLLIGKVIKGDKIGRKIGFPTANIQVENPYKLIPKQGVYAVKVKVSEQQYCGMLNIGTRPTISITQTNKRLEVNLFDFNEDIYNQEIKLYFYQRIRNEQKFQNLDELKKQLEIDKQKIKKIFASLIY